MQTEITEWAEFSLKEGVTPTQLVAACQAMQQDFLDRQAGYISRDLLSLGSGRYADLAVWASRASADEAMAAAQQSPACAAYFGLLQVDSHPKLGYALWRSTRALPVGDFGGMEFSLFRLREGAEESALIPAVRRMVDGLYQNEPGYLGHYVVGDGAGLYADVMLTQTVAQARALCGKWGTGPFAQPCLPYLEKIDPESIDLKFWSRIV